MFDMPPVRAATPASPAGKAAGQPGLRPAGWPAAVLTPGQSGWEQSAIAWLLDQCPGGFRAHAAWRRHPVALAWIAQLHLEAQLDAMRDAYRNARVVLGELDPQAVSHVMLDIEAEGLRLRASAQAVELIRLALRGLHFVPRL